MGVHFLTQYRNPLAYPAGYTPGFDPNHVAARNPRFSGVASGGNFISILRGVRGTITGTLTSSIHSRLGPALVFGATSGDRAEFGIYPDISSPGITMAAIGVWDGTIAYAYMMGDPSTCSIFHNGNTVFQFNRWGATSHNVNFDTQANVPYLWIASSDNATVTNFLAKRLDTGQVKTGSTAGSAASSGFTMMVGNSPVASHSWKGHLAATMSSGCCLSLAEMLQWAADPWSFWYPNPGDNWIAAQAAGGLFKITGNPRSLAGFGGGLAA